MPEQRIETDDSPYILIPHCEGQVVVKSWRQTAVSIQGAAFDVNDEQDGLIRISSQADLFLAVPAQSSLSLGEVWGDVTLKHLQGGITGDDLQGNVRLNNVDAVQIEQVGQNLTAENFNGLLGVEQVQGNLWLQRVSSVKIGAVQGSAVIEYANGVVELGQVGGRLTLTSISGDVLIANALADVTLQNLGGVTTLPSVLGDIWLVGGLCAGEQTFVSEQTIYVYWPQDAPLHLFANAPQLDNMLSLTHEIKRQEGDQLILTGHIEEGKTQLTLKAGQRIALQPLTAPPRFSPDEFALPSAPVSALAQTVQTAVHAALAESAMGEEIEERVVTAVVIALSDWEPESKLPAPFQTESQTHILQLVHDGQISVEQAALLLQALSQSD